MKVLVYLEYLWSIEFINFHINNTIVNKYIEQKISFILKTLLFKQPRTINIGWRLSSHNRRDMELFKEYVGESWASYNIVRLFTLFIWFRWMHALELRSLSLTEIITWMSNHTCGFICIVFTNPCHDFHLKLATDGWLHPDHRWSWGTLHVTGRM